MPRTLQKNDSSARPVGWINPYAEQNAKIPGYRFTNYGEVVPNTPLPGIPSAEGKVYVPLDMIQRRGPYKDDDDGWTEVVNKRQRRRERLTRSGGWVGSN